MDTLNGTLLLCFFLCQVSIICIEASSWTIDLPSTVKGLLGSCVVIPCSFNYPSPRKAVKKFTGLWFDGGNHLVYHPAGTTVVQQYHGRIEMVGDIRAKNCSFKIDPLRQSDTGPFHFRVEMEDYEQFSYRGDTVSIAMIRELSPINLTVKEVMDGPNVTASCSVTHSCPASPPVFFWSHYGQEHYGAQALDNGQWEATSTLTFPIDADNKNTHLQCAVTYKGGQQQKASKILNIKYAPKDVKVEYKAGIKEGEVVHLICSCDANPPASSYEWHDDHGAELYKGRLLLLPKVSRHTGVLYCTAINIVGKAKSGPVQLDVAYAPEIKNVSSCSLEHEMVKCVCIAESNPPSSVYFVLPNGTVLTKANIEIQKSVTIGTLQAHFPSFGFVSCVVNNSIGGANTIIMLPGKMLSLYIYIISAAGALAVMVVIVIIVVVKKWRTTNVPVTEDQKTVPPLQTVAAARKRVEADHRNMYSNHTYGNMREVEWTTDCNAIYSNL
ncbi:sialic acid-binding Ig-like lectin 14 isoform X2 [Dunckerocampus dactyliophorus]|uniref:sialic acid-binding Ig-like lectin 14 isoform X2 n=1 Tax=Dunckerocampus dactyliophorus TaxID=161453 RepID=UPI002405A6CD|nr:sialic acid-binding Ig-like lectin 14 isoform X2 [Dunckerocampus dactyliophorus]